MVHSFTFSIIIPFYNSKDYLRATLDSLLNQTLSFKEHFQVILIDDGSTDSSLDIAKEFAEKYPQNIEYHTQTNQGVSAARNHGMKYIKGQWVNFLDSDDTWQPNAFENLLTFIKKHNDINIIGCRMKFFEASDEYHPLDYKFTGDYIADIKKNIDAIQFHITSTILNASIIDRFSFQTALKYGEDALYVVSQILTEGKFALLQSVNHNYRKRLNQSSAVQGKEANKDWYLVTPKLFYQELINLSNSIYGETLPYIQHALMYDLQFRFLRESPACLNEEEFKTYRESLHNLLINISDEIIWKQRYITAPYKIVVLKEKYGYDIRENFEYQKGKFLFHNLTVFKMSSPNFLSLRFIDCEQTLAGEVLSLNFVLASFLELKDFHLFLMDQDGKKFFFESEPYKVKPRTSFDGNVRNALILTCKLPFANLKKLAVYCQYKTEKPIKLRPSSHIFSKLASNYPVAYCVLGTHIIQMSQYGFTITPYSRLVHIKKELRVLAYLLSHKKGNLCLYRLLYHLFKWIKKKEIWFISDRVYQANDNGEHFFHYVNSQKNASIEPYFILEKGCKDYSRMQKLGKVIPFNSIKYKLYFLLSDKIISSAGNNYVINAFDEDRDYMKDLYHFNYVFLQHGITKDDLSKWLHKYHMNLSLFVTSAKPEYESIINGNYHYTQKEIKLTGFPRHDNLLRMSLNNTAQKEILIIPTWRKSLAGTFSKENGESIYSPYFKTSDFFQFYNTLINDKRLLDTMRKYGYRGTFCLHPSQTKQYVDFIGNDVIKINQGYVNYQQEFVNSRLLITDYSSVAFDFSYLQKPVIYSQFDAETFFDGQHAYDKGYFDYKTMGFGPVCHNLDETITAIIRTIKRDCALEPKYEKRIHNFYNQLDDNNCKRVYDAILDL